MLDKAVSLFTREWIEIVVYPADCAVVSVSLFTREWIEIVYLYCDTDESVRSPSLRGSGLKCHFLLQSNYNWCLPLYEGVD